MAKPGIKTTKPRTLMDVPLRDSFIENARTDPLLMPPVKLKPAPKKLRKGLWLAIRKICYRILDRT